MLEPYLQERLQLRVDPAMYSAHRSMLRTVGSWSASGGRAAAASGVRLVELGPLPLAGIIQPVRLLEVHQT
jgi:hypothetical protein